MTKLLGHAFWRVESSNQTSKQKFGNKSKLTAGVICTLTSTIWERFLFRLLLS